MSFTKRQIAWFGAGTLWSLASGFAAMADDTELFVGAAAGGAAPPNILFIIDNSISMETQVTTETGTSTRLAIVKDLASGILSSVAGANVGLMIFNPPSEEGGRVRHAIEDVATGRDEIRTAILDIAAETSTPLSETLYEAALYYAGGPVHFGEQSVAESRDPQDSSSYLTPIASPCQRNYIVLLTDGEPSGDESADASIRAMQDAEGGSFASLVGASCDAETYPDGFNPSGGECLDDLAQFLHDGDFSALPGQQNISTYTVGFTVDLPALADAAKRGGGEYYTANDTQTLSSALSSIVTSILTTRTAFVSPTVAVDAFNRAHSSSDVFVGVFEPSISRHWPGNIKKYRLRDSDAEIVDANGSPAVDPATRFFRDTAQSFWSSEVDGADVEAGGAANKIPASRIVVTNLVPGSLMAARNRIARSNDAITDALLGTTADGAPTRDDVIDFINNVDRADADRDDDTDDARMQFGDPLHSQPVPVLYGPGPRGLLFVGTNDGYLHALDLDTGVERWAFIPTQFLADQVELYRNDATAEKHYGIDGSLRVQVVADRDGEIEAGEKVYLFFGLRRGGNFYYALDVSNPDNPRLMWRIGPGELPGVGQTWSAPVPARIDVNDGTQNADDLVLVIGGGYEPDQDDIAASTDTRGNAIYVVDSVSGELLWHGSKSGASANFDANGRSMDYSIPADVKVLDLDGDRYADRLYAADMGGQVWRFDIANGQPASSLIAGGVIAQLGAAGQAMPAAGSVRRFYYAPDVALVGTRDHSFIHVGIGSGHRARPASLETQDRFYALRDHRIGQMTQREFDALTPITDASLTPVGLSGRSDLGGASAGARATIDARTGTNGWRLDLDDGGWQGEKVLAEARTFDHEVFFTTFRPSADDDDSCAPRLGTNRLYRMSLFDGRPVTRVDGETENGELDVSALYVENVGGILPTPQVIFLDGDADGDGVPDNADPDDDDDGLLDDQDPDIDGDGIANEVDTSRGGGVINCVGLRCFPAGFSNTPVRTFWSQEGVDGGDD